MSPKQLDKFTTRLVELTRPELIETLRNFECAFSIDFSDDQLHSMSIERLRHIVLAAGLHAQNLQN